MSFDDRLRDELRRATESAPIDAEHALRDVRSEVNEPALAAPDDTVVVPLEVIDTPRRHNVRTQRIIGVAAAIALLAGALALPFALRDDGHTRNDATKRTAPHTPKKTAKPNPAALRAVASALDATTSTGSFHVEYTLRETASTAPTTTSCRTVEGYAITVPYRGTGDAPSVPPTQPPATVCGGNVNTSRNVTTTGNATVNVSPFAMKAVSNVSSFGDVTVRVDDSKYWETTGPNATAGPTPTGTGSAISSFASLVEGTLGRREGAGAMMGLASPNGYLMITRDAITGAQVLGTGTVDGQAVTTYRVSVDPDRLADVPGLSAEQAKTIDSALAVLHEEGFSANTTDVSVNAAGVVVHTVNTNSFADGGTVVSDYAFSQFGCAGAVDIPGRPVSPVSGDCTNPDEPTTTIPAATINPTTVAPGATSASDATATTTTGPPTDTTATVVATTIPPGTNGVLGVLGSSGASGASGTQSP